MRLREIDLLRGIAVLLVMFRHSHLIPFLHDGGWIGVDLFFVLSGFLVSGLLFREYQKYGDVKAGLFLVRRGFKIYPLFYLTIVLAFWLEFLQYGAWPARYQIISELLFLQSYIKGILGVTWSLAVEEHFYLILSLLILLFARRHWLTGKNYLVVLCCITFAGCFLLRLINWQSHPFSERTHFFPTHLRIDSLMFGVFISYLYHFRSDAMLNLFGKNRVLWFLLSLLLISSAWIFEIQSLLMNVVGLSLLYLGFGILLILMVTDASAYQKLSRLVPGVVLGAVTRIGFYSYSIYLWHMMVIKYLLPRLLNAGWFNTDSIKEFVFYTVASVLMGMGMSLLVEQPFLKLRDRYFPGRSKVLIPSKD